MRRAGVAHAGSTTLLISMAAAALLGCASAGPAPARAPEAPTLATRSPEEVAIIATIQRLFDAMRTRDTAAIRAISHPELRLFVPGEQNGQPVLAVRTLDQFIASVAAAPETLDERALDHVVHVDGPLASVWTYYDFRVGNRFSHCGYDAFHLVRDTRGWLIVGLAYTIRQQGCT